LARGATRSWGGRRVPFLNPFARKVGAAAPFDLGYYNPCCWRSFFRTDAPGEELPRPKIVGPWIPSLNPGLKSPLSNNPRPCLLRALNLLAAKNNTRLGLFGIFRGRRGVFMWTKGAVSALSWEDRTLRASRLRRVRIWPRSPGKNYDFCRGHQPAGLRPGGCHFFRQFRGAGEIPGCTSSCKC